MTRPASQNCRQSNEERRMWLTRYLFSLSRGGFRWTYFDIFDEMINEASGDGDGRMWRQPWVHILSRISHFSAPTIMFRRVLLCATAESGSIHHALYCHIIGFISPELLLGSHTFCPGIINIYSPQCKLVQFLRTICLDCDLWQSAPFFLVISCFTTESFFCKSRINIFNKLRGCTWF